MNKRQAKKNRTAYKNKFAKIKGIVKVDATHVTPGSQINVYISNEFETEKVDPRDLWVEHQNRQLSDTKRRNKGYSHFVHLLNGRNLGITIYVSDTNKSYYVIKSREEVAV